MCAMGVFGLDQNLAHSEWHWLQMRLEGCEVLRGERGEKPIGDGELLRRVHGSLPCWGGRTRYSQPLAP